jgi:GNAT superfamily N-acetyltransferase
VEIRRLTPGELTALASTLLRLQRRAYAVEAELIGDQRIPTLHESESELRAAGLDWLVAVEAEVLLGALGFTVSDGVVDIDRLVVEPAQHRRGIGRALVRAALAVGDRSTVSTGRDNPPARRLYESLGFTHRVDREVVDGLWVSEYERRPRP